MKLNITGEPVLPVIIGEDLHTVDKNDENDQNTPKLVWNVGRSHWIHRNVDHIKWSGGKLERSVYFIWLVLLH